MERTDPARLAPVYRPLEIDGARGRCELCSRRELLQEIGVQSERPDVWIEMDSEAIATATPDRPKCHRRRHR